MIFYLSIVIYLFSNVNSLLLFEEINYSSSELIKFVNQLIRYEDLSSKNILVIYEYSSIVDEFYNEVSKNERKFSLVTIKLNENQNVSMDTTFLSDYNPDLIIIFTGFKDPENVERIIFNLETYSFWNIRSKFLVISYELLNKKWIKDAFKSFWERQIFKVLISFWENEVKIIRYNPFIDEYSIDSSSNKIITWQKLKDMNKHSIILYNLDNIYDDALIKTSENKYVGKDGFFFGTLIEQLNSSLQIHNLSEDFPPSVTNAIDINVPANEFLSVLSELCDFDALANCAGVFAAYDDLDHVFINERDDMFIVLPKSREIPKYLYIFLIIPFIVWVATFCTLILVALAVFGTRKYCNCKTKIGDAFLDSYR